MSKETEVLMEGEKKVMVAERNKRWFITHWDDEIACIENIKFSINQFIQSEEKKPVK